MKIATYNMLKGGSKRVHWQAMLEQDVDVLLFQESLPQDEHLPPTLFPQFLNQSVWQAAGSNRWGSGVFCKSGIVTPISVDGYEGWVVGAKITSADWQKRRQSTLFFSLHAPNGVGSYRGQVTRILDQIALLAGNREVVIGGDFNIAVSNYETCPSPPPERLRRPLHKRDLAIQHRLANEFNLVNCWTTANPNQVLPQTLRWTGDRTIPYHCDGIFAPSGWIARLVSCDVLSDQRFDQLSDHNAVLAEFA